MQLQRQTSLKEPRPETCVIIGCYADHTFTPQGTRFDQESHGALKRLLTRGDLKLELAECLFIPELPNVEGKVLLVFCGEKTRSPKFRFVKYYKRLRRKFSKSMQSNVFVISLNFM